VAGAGSGRGRLPTFAIVGAMKAGTTSLAAWLNRHPAVFVAPEKETRFFNDPQRWSRGVEWYAAQFAGAGDGAGAGFGEAVAVGDATPMMSNELAVSRMAELLPGLTVIVSLRNPADRAWSHYQHLRATGDERRRFEAAIAAERADPPGARGNPPRDYLHRSDYLPQVRRLLAHWGPGRVHAVLFDDLVRDPLGVAREVAAVIGVDPALVPADVGEVHDPRPSWRSARVEAAVRAREGRLPPAVVRRLRAWNAAPPRPYPAMPGAVRASLLAEWHDDLLALGEVIGRDLSAWLR
jgi:hypothetical protein